jgi:phosphotriesterase-related protein
MPTIPTLTGVLDPGQLGVTLMHEHIFIRTPEVQEAFPGFMDWDEEAEIELARNRLAALRRGGVDTIVDCTAPGLGRDVRLMARAGEGTGLNVIACTGYYTYATLPFPFQYHGPGKLFEDRGDELLVSLFVRDIEEGIQGTGIRAGLLKCCTDEPGVTPDIARVLRAVARAHHRTGVPITTHTHAPTRRGLDQQRIFQEEGVDLGRVIIGHCNDTTDFGYLEQLIANGSYIGFDRCGLHLVVDLESQLGTMAELCRRGYAERLVFSHDRHCRSDWFTEEEVESVVPDWHYDYIRDSVLPALAARGVSAEQVQQMMVRNPRDIFSAGSRPADTVVPASAVAPGPAQ